MVNKLCNNGLVAISGITGIGKTSLLKWIDEVLGQKGFCYCYTVTEPLKDNHLFKIINEDMHKYMYANQIEFLIRFLDSYNDKDKANLDKPVVRDRCIEEVWLFTYLNHSLGYISGQDFLLFKDIYDKLTSGVKKPDYLIMLDAPEDEVFARIVQRGRGEEQNIKLSYLKKLRRVYNDVFPNMFPSTTEIIKIPWSDEVDIKERYKVVIEKLIDIL